MTKYFEIKIPSGSTLSGLAKKYSTSIPDILELNPYIKDPAVIQAGKPLKIPKFPFEKRPGEYKQALETGIDRLFRGEYGREWAREKLLKELEIGYPYIDVAVDIYSRIPDNWQVEPLPLPQWEAIVTAEKKKSWYDTISSFVTKKIVQPFRTEVREAVFDLAEYVNELPTHQELLKLAGEKIKSTVFSVTSAWKEKWEALPDIKIPKVGETTVPIFTVPSGSEIGKSISERASQDYSKLTIQIKDQAEFRRNNPWIIETPLKIGLPPSAFKITSEGRLGRVLTDEERARSDVGWSLGIFRGLEKDLAQVIKNAELHGTVFLREEGIIVGIDEAQTKSNQDKLINERFEKQIALINKANPLVAEYNRKVQQNNNLESRIIGFVNAEMGQIFDFLSKPENLDTKKMTEFSKNLQEKFGTPKAFKDLDTSLLDLQDFRKTEGEFMDTAADYQKEFLEIQDELEILITSEIDEFFENQAKLEKLSDEEILGLQDFYSKSKSIIDKVFTLSGRLKEIADWNDINKARSENLSRRANLLSLRISEKLEKVVSFFQTPEFIEGLTEYSIKTARPQTELLKALKAFQENRIWLKENEEEVKVQTFGLEGEAKETQQNINAFAEEINQINLDLFDLIRKVNKAGKDLEIAVFKDNWDAWEYQRKVMDRWMNPLKHKLKDIVSAETLVNFAGYYVPEAMLPTLGALAGMPLGPAGMVFGASVGLALKKPAARFFTWLNDVVWRQGIMPHLGAIIAETRFVCSYLDFELGTIDLRQLLRPFTKEEKDFWKEEAWVAQMKEFQTVWRLPVDELLAEGPILERHNRIANFYRNPGSYEEVTYKEEVSIEDLVPEGRGSGPLLLEIASLNPSIEDIHHVPAGTTIRVPRFDPLPTPSDIFLKRTTKVDWQMHQPWKLWLYDMFFDVKIDPTGFLWGACMNVAAKGLKVFGQKSYKALASLAGKHKWGAQAQNLFDFNAELLRFLCNRPITEEFRLKVPTLSRLRSNMMQLTPLKYLPWDFRKAIRSDLETKLSEIDPVLKSIEVWDAIEEVSKTYKKTPDILKKELFNSFVDPSQTPTESAITFWKKFGMNSMDVWKLNQEYPDAAEFLKQIIKSYVVSPERAKWIANAYNAKYLSSSKVTQDSFDLLIGSKGAKQIAETKTVLRAKYADYPSDVQRGFNLFEDYMKETETFRLLYIHSKEVIRIPGKTRIAEIEPENRALLGGQPYRSYPLGEVINYVYDPDAFKAGKLPKVIGDVIYGEAIKTRMDVLDQIMAYSLKTSFQSTTWEAIKPPSKKKYPVIIPGGREGPERMDSFLDVLVTSYYDDVLAKMPYGKQMELKEILEKISPNTKKIKGFKYSYARPWDDITREMAEEGKAKRFARVIDKKEWVVDHRGAKTYLQTAAKMEWERIENLDLYIWWKKNITTLDPKYLKRSPQLQLEKFIFEMETLRLTDFQKILLLGDEFSPIYKRTVLRELEKLKKSRAYKYNQAMMRSKETALLKEGVEKAEISRYLRGARTESFLNLAGIDEVAQAKIFTSPLLKKIELKQILPRIMPYLGELPKFGADLEDAIMIWEEGMREVVGKKLLDFQKAKTGEDIIKIQVSMLGDLKEIPLKGVYIPTLATDSGVLTKAQKIEILSVTDPRLPLAERKIPLVYDFTRKGKAVIEFLIQQRRPFQILKKPLGARTLTTKALLNQIENLGVKSYLNYGLISDDGVLRLLQKSFDWPKFQYDKVKRASFALGPEGEKIFYSKPDYQILNDRLDAFERVLKSELGKTKEGRRLIKKLMEPPKTLMVRDYELEALGGKIKQVLPPELKRAGEVIDRGSKDIQRAISDVVIPEMRIEKPRWREFTRNLNDTSFSIRNKLGITKLDLTFRNKRIKTINVSFDFLSGHALDQESALRKAEGLLLSTFKPSLLSKVLQKSFPKLIEKISFDADDFLVRLSRVFDPLSYSNKKTWLKSLESFQELNKLKKVRAVIESDIPILQSRVKSLNARLRNVDDISRLERLTKLTSSEEFALNQAKADLSIRSQLSRNYDKFSLQLRSRERELRRLAKKLAGSEGTVDDFLSSFLIEGGFPISEELDLLRLQAGKQQIPLGLIETIDSKIGFLKQSLKPEQLKKAVAPPPPAVISEAKLQQMMDVSKAAINADIVKLENIREIIPAFQISVIKKILPTFDEIWDVKIYGTKPDSLKEKLEKLTDLMTKRKGLKGTPLLINEFKNLKYQVPEVLIKEKSVKELRKLLTGDLFAKTLPEVKVISFESFETQKLISKLKELEKLGIKVVLDESGLMSAMVAKVPFDFTIVKIKELLPENLRYASLEPNSIASAMEAKGMQELRKIFWDSKKVAIVGLGGRPRWLYNLFRKYLGPSEKFFLDAAFSELQKLADLKKKAEPGPTFKFSRKDQQTLPAIFKRQLTPFETIEEIKPMVERDVAIHETRKYLETIDWTLKKVKDEDAFRGGKVLIVARDRTFMTRPWITTLEEGIEREMDFYLPRKMNRGELAVADFLRGKKIKWGEIDLTSQVIRQIYNGADDKLPFYLLPSEDFGLKGKRFEIFEGLQKRNRIMKSFEGMQKQFSDDLISQNIRLGKDLRKMIPSVLRDEVFMKTIGIEEGIARLLAMADRKEIKIWWFAKKENLLKSTERVMREEIMKLSKRNYLEPWEARTVTKQISRYRATLNGFDESVFKWNRGQTFPERMRAKLANDLHYIYLKKADAWGLGSFPIEVSKTKRALLLLAEKTFWLAPRGLKILKTVLQWGRTVWVNMILFWNVSWHIWNNLDDALREAMKAKSIKLFFEVQASFLDATLRFIKKFGGDTVRLALEASGFYTAAPKLKKLLKKLPPGLARPLINEIDKTLKRGEFKPFNLDNYYRAKKTGILGNLQESFYRKHIREIVNWKQVSTKLPSGEIMMPDDARFLASSGLANILEDPLVVTRRLNHLDDTIFFQRVGKRILVLDADVKLYANACEELRRLQLAYNLLFDKAMSLSKAEAEIKKWMFDYRDLTAAGQFFRGIFPFYTFKAKAIQLYLDLCLKYSFPVYIAGRTLLRVWSELTVDLPEYYQDRVPVGNEVYWNPHFSIIDFLQIFKDPTRLVQEFIDNPLRTGIGLGWDPYLASTIEALQGKGYFSLSWYLREHEGWTQWEIDNFLKKERIKEDDYATAPEKVWQFMLQFIPFAPAIKALTEVDEAFVMRAIPIMNSKVVREWLKSFGLNIKKYNDLERLRHVYFDLPPRLRGDWLKELNQENPDLYKIWREYFIISGIVKIYNAKGQERLDLLEKYQEHWHIDTFYMLEDKEKGSGYDWLNKNPRAAVYLKTHWEGLDLTPWRLAARDRHNQKELERILKTYLKEVPANMTEEKIDRLATLNIDHIYTGAFSKEELRNDFFDKYGNVIPLTIEEANIILRDEKWLEKGLEEIGSVVIKKADQLFLEWQMLSKKAKEEKRFEDALYYHHLATAFGVLPPGIEDMAEAEQAKYWDEWRKTFDRVLSDKEKVRYATELPEMQRKYLEAMEVYIKTWQKIFSYFKEDDFDFFKIFYAQEKWFQDLYFLKHRNKKIWYPFAQEWVGMLRAIEIKEKETGMFLRNERKKCSEFFWAPGNRIAREAWDKDNSGFLEYMDTWKKIFMVTENNPERYFDVFYAQPRWFQDRFFKANPEKQLYYPFVRKWIQLIEIDKTNWEVRTIRTELAKSWFWSKKHRKARQAYAKANMITKDKSIVDYLKIWQEIIEITEETPDQYFPVFYSQADWFKKRFFRNNPNKAVYYPFVKRWTELIKEDQEIFKQTGERSNKASNYFWADTKTARISRKLYDKDNPGILNYLKAWNKIIDQTEGNPERYFELFYQQSASFQNRFFKNNPDKAIYYPHLREWIRLIALDKKNWEEKQKRTALASQWFWRKEAAKARELYGKANMITATQSILDYLKLWEVIMRETEESPEEFFAIFDKQSQWFKDHYFSNHPDRKIYYPFAKELGKQKPEDFARFFWSAKYEKERQAWERDKPGFLAYMGFWKQLSKYAEIGNWQLYFNFYFSAKNEEYRLRHWRNNPLAKARFVAFREYSLMPSMTWEERRAKREFLKRNPQLLEWWRENLSTKEAEVRTKVEHYFELLDNIKAEGRGRSYFLEYRKWKAAAERYLKMNPEVLLFLQKTPRFYTGEKAIIFGLIRSYESLTFPEEKRAYLEDHPELTEYFLNCNPPGIRRILRLQTEYFKLSKEAKAAFLEVHPELLEWWDVTKLPWTYFFAPERFRIFENTISKIDKAFSFYESGEWTKAETLRLALPDLYKNPGTTAEDEWFKNRVYRIAMETWIKLVEQNEFMAVYYFRQLPRWVRDQYYSKHPEKRYLSTEPLERFIDEPLRVWSSLNPELAWAFYQHYKYGKNMPYQIGERVKEIFLKHGIWRARADWTQADWQDYWRRRSIKLNEVRQFDYENLPLLRKELNKVIRIFPLRLRPKPFGKPRIGVLQPFF